MSEVNQEFAALYLIGKMRGFIGMLLIELDNGSERPEAILQMITTIDRMIDALIREES